MEVAIWIGASIVAWAILMGVIGLTLDLRDTEQVLENQDFVCVNNTWTAEIKRVKSSRKPSCRGYGSGRT